MNPFVKSRLVTTVGVLAALLAGCAGKKAPNEPGPAPEVKARVEKALRELATDLLESQTLRRNVVAELKDYLKRTPDVVGAAYAIVPKTGGKLVAPYVTRKDGELVVKGLPEDWNPTASSSAWLTGPARSRKASWTQPFLDKDGSGVEVFRFSVPLADMEGKVYAVVVNDVAVRR